MSSSVPLVITCPDCGGVAHLLTHLPEPGEAPLEDGDVVAYRCADCLDRWDMVLDEGDE
jgi:hypothetical protein